MSLIDEMKEAWHNDPHIFVKKDGVSKRIHIDDLAKYEKKGWVQEPIVRATEFFPPSIIIR